MKLTLSEKHNPNYVGSVVEIKTLRPHTNADRLQIANIYGNSVIVGIDTKIGDVGFFFPLESQLQPKFLHENNLYREKRNNEDRNKAGFFEDHGRVKAVKLRGEKSEGIFIPRSGGEVGKDFDTINDELVVKKYVIKELRTPGTPGSKSDKKVVKKFDRIIENQFRLHVDTSQLKKNIHQLEQDDIIGVHYKKHGTSWVVGNVLTKRELNWKEKLAKWVGIPVQEETYDIIYSSRKVIKNKHLNTELKNDGFYNYDLWADIAKELNDISPIPKGYTLYGEAVGYLPDGKAIQKGYDYGCKPGEHKVYIYRITITNPDGKVVELDDTQIEQYCAKNGYNYADTFLFYGSVLELFTIVAAKQGWKGEKVIQALEDARWRDDLLALLIAEYNDKDCYMCVNKVPEEGVVIRKQNLYDYDAFKLKSFRFFEWETKQLDEGEVSIEDEQSS